MAEGHSIVRWARALRPMIGEGLEKVEVPARWSERAADLPGQHLADIGTHGKHLLLRLSGSLTVHCHAMIYGAWQFGRPGMALRKPEENVRLRLQTEQREAVFFNGPVVELLTEQELREHEKLTALGPDVLHERFDREEVWRRLQRDRKRAIGDAILDQTIVAGVGNIFKSESLFVAAVDPRAPVAAFSRETIDRIWEAVIPMMRQNAARSGPIVTLNRGLRRGGERYWAYRRRGTACFRCNASIEMLRQGQNKRTTYFCPACQKRPFL